MVPPRAPSFRLGLGVRCAPPPGRQAGLRLGRCVCFGRVDRRLVSAMRLYSELAPWFHLLTHPPTTSRRRSSSRACSRRSADGEVATLLELGSGGGNNASHLKSRFELHAHRHLRGDARAQPLAQPRVRARPGRHADAPARARVRRRARPRRDLVHDDRGRPARGDRDGGGARAAGRRGRCSCPTRRARRFARRRRDRRPRRRRRAQPPLPALDARRRSGRRHVPGRLRRAAARAGAADARVHDQHTEGLFSEATWRRLLEEAGLEPVEHGVPDPYEGEHAVFAARRPA